LVRAVAGGAEALTDWRLDRISAAERGENPMTLATMTSGFAVIGDTQFLPGYCVLLASPSLNHLTDLLRDRRSAFLLDMSLIGEAIEEVCRPNGLVRVNYEILGNTDAYLHAHVFPRYDWEPADRLGSPVFLYPRDRWTDPTYAYSDREHGSLLREIARVLRGLVADL
jgi:diadenosine tetraphosphate (Ap4A) HIT family hydrolase